MGELCFSLMLERNKVPANLNVTDMIGNIIKGGKLRPNNPNRRKGANERKNKGKIID